MKSRFSLFETPKSNTIPKQGPIQNIPVQKPIIYEILENHTHHIENVEHVFYSTGQNNMLFVSFTGAINNNAYGSVTWFYQNPNISGHFLFLKDDLNHYTTYNNEKYSKVIRHYMDKYNIQTLVTYGTSMGGAASIIYGLKFKADFILSIDPETVNYELSDILQQIQSMENEYQPKIYLNYTFSKIEGDIAILPSFTEKMIQVFMQKNVILSLHPYRSTEHLAFIPSKEYLIQIIQSFLSLKVTNYYLRDT
jgi:hypothetical protein